MTNTEFYQTLTVILQKEGTPEDPKVIEIKEAFSQIQWKVRNIVEKIQKLDLFPDDFSISDFLEENINTPIARVIVQQQKPWLDDKLTIGLVGHFSSGKTSVLNSLFGEHFATHGDETTAIPCYLTYGTDVQKYHLVNKDNTVVDISNKEAQILNFATTNDFPFAKMFDYLVKENNSPLLQNISFIDTPGLSSTIKGHADSTNKIIQYCDIILWFVPITAGDLDSPNIDYIKKYVHGKPIFFVFTFADDPSKDYEQVKSQVLKTAENNEIEVAGILRYEHPHSWMEEAMPDMYQKRLATLRSDFEDLYNQSISQYGKYNPMTLIVNTLDLLLNFVVENQQKINELIAKCEKEQNDELNAYKKNIRSLTTSMNAITDRFSSVVDTFNSRCSGATFCWGASDAMCNQLNAIREKFIQMIDYYNEMDASKLVSYGQYESTIDKFKDMSASLDEIKSDLKEITDIFK